MIRLHHCAETRSMRPLWLLYELGVAFDVVEWPFDKSLRSAEYRALNPVGRVPALELNGTVVWESGAILELLCEMFPDAGLGRAPGDKDRAKYLTGIHFAETISQHSAALTQQHIVLYEDAMRSPTVMQLEARRLGKCYDALEAELGEHWLPTGFSAADVALGQALYMARHFVTTDAHPKLTTWYDRITARPAFQKACPATPQLYQKEFYPAWVA